MVPGIFLITLWTSKQSPAFNAQGTQFSPDGSCARTIVIVDIITRYTGDWCVINLTLGHA